MNEKIQHKLKKNNKPRLFKKNYPLANVSTLYQGMYESLSNEHIFFLSGMDILSAATLTQYKYNERR